VKLQLQAGILLALVLSSPLAAEVRGRVTTSDGSVPVEHALVVGGGRNVYTDLHGLFILEGVDAPCRIEVSHPRFETARVEVGPGSEPEVRMEPRRQLYERVVVTANREGQRLAPVVDSSTSIAPEDSTLVPSTVTDLVSQVPGVAESGQGGLFQNFAVRGISGQRLSALVLDVPIITERRAGAAISFIDPLLLDRVEVVRGPASTLYGSNAMGGVVQALPRRFEDLMVDVGYETQGSERHAAFAWGGGPWSVGIAGRQRDRSETASGTERNDAYTQACAVLDGAWEIGGKGLEITLAPSSGHDIGKDNTDYPARTTTYPTERHLIFKAALDAGEWRAAVFAHPNRLVTEVVRDDGDWSEVRNRSLDFGGNFQIDRSFGPSASFLAGVDLLARRNVNADEERLEDGILEELHTLDHALQDDAAVYATARFHHADLTTQAGVRYSWEAQDNAGADRRSSSAPSAFIGLNVSLGQGYEIMSSVGTGMRFPSLTERFYTGTTGRGGVIGNPDLEEERSLNADLGVRHYGEKVYVEAFAFHNIIRNYIEQVDLTEDISTFQNLRSGTITGAEVDGLFVTGPVQLILGGAIQRGRDDDGLPLVDVPPARAKIGARFTKGRFMADVAVEERMKKDDPADGEKKIPGATLVFLKVGVDLGSGLALRLSGENLLNEDYFRSADRKAPEAPGRSFGLALRWTR